MLPSKVVLTLLLLVARFQPVSHFFSARFQPVSCFFSALGFHLTALSSSGRTLCNRNVFFEVSSKNPLESELLADLLAILIFIFIPT